MVPCPGQEQTKTLCEARVTHMQVRGWGTPSHSFEWGVPLSGFGGVPTPPFRKIPGGFVISRGFTTAGALLRVRRGLSVLEMRALN